MISQQTPNIGLPLPHPDNLLEEDIGRIRAALGAIDQILSDTQTGGFESSLLTIRQATSLIKTQTIVVKHHAFS